MRLNRYRGEISFGNFTEYKRKYSYWIENYKCGKPGVVSVYACKKIAKENIDVKL